MPILIAANPKEKRLDDPVVERILRRVATYGDGWQTDGTPVETFRQRFERICEYAEAQGRDSSKFESCLHLMVNINDDREQALQEAQHFLTSYYGAGAISREKWTFGWPAGRRRRWRKRSSPTSTPGAKRRYCDLCPQT